MLTTKILKGIRREKERKGTLYSFHERVNTYQKLSGGQALSRTTFPFLYLTKVSYF